MKQIGQTLKKRGLKGLADKMETIIMNDTLVVTLIDFMRVLTGTIL